MQTKIVDIKPIKLTPYQKGFLEGLIDSEGCLSFTRGIDRGQLYFTSCEATKTFIFL